MNDDLNSAVSRRERKKLETRDRIIKLSMYLFKKNGFETTTMEKIAREADVAKGTLYNYFPVKEAIVCAYWMKSVRDLKYHLLEMIQLLPDTRSRLLKTFNKAAFELFKSKEDIYTIYLSYWLRNLINPSSDRRMESGFEDIFSMIVKLGQQSGEIRKEMPVEMLVKHLEVTFLTACLNWLSDPKMFPLEKNLTDTVTLFVEGAVTGTRKTRSRPDGRKQSPGGQDQGSLL